MKCSSAGWERWGERLRGLGERRETGGRNSRGREKMNPNVLSLGMVGHPRRLMDTSTAVPWVLHSGAMTLLVLSGPLPIRLSQAMQTQSIPGGKEPSCPLVCGMSRWMMLCPRVLGGVPRKFLCAHSQGRRWAPCAGSHVVMTEMNALSLGLSLVASGLGALVGRSPGYWGTGPGTGLARRDEDVGVSGWGPAP